MKLLLLLNWVRATPDRPFMSYKSSSQTRLIGHNPQTRAETRSQRHGGTETHNQKQQSASLFGSLQVIQSRAVSSI